MALAAANLATDSSDPVSNAVVSPEASLFVRQILQSALSNSAGAAASWASEAKVLLANVMMNDHLNWWNVDFPVDVALAQQYANQVLGRPPSPPRPVLAMAYHARGLTYRASGQPKLALQDFRTVRTLHYGFARGHAQFANQKVLLGREQEAHAPLDRARELSPRHPACGYFYWADGRAYFQEMIWSNAIYWLTESVAALPTVWYNRLYLACAQDAAGQTSDAQQTLNDFLGNKSFGKKVLDQLAAWAPPNPGDPLFAARRRFYTWLQKVAAAP